MIARLVSSLVHRHLDPVESAGELLFGLIMTLTMTLGARLLAQRDDLDAHELALALIGCNAAWGVIDAALYLLGSTFTRNRRVQLLRRLKAAASERQALEIIREELGLDGRRQSQPANAEQDRAAIDSGLLALIRSAEPRRARLRARDFAAAATIAVLVAVTALPGAVVLLIVKEPVLALRLCNAVQIVLLFGIGFAWAHYSGANPWRAGMLVALLAVALVGVAVALGG